MGVGKVDLAKGSRTWGIDGKRHQESLGFSDLVDCCGKIDGMLAYYGVRSSLDVRPRAGQEGKRPRPEEPYLAYLDALDPPRGGDFADDMLARVKGRKPELAYGDTRPSPARRGALPRQLDRRNGLELLDSTARTSPGSMVVNFAGPHAPLDITRSDREPLSRPRPRDRRLRQPHGYAGSFDAAHHTRIRQNYAAMIENIDRWLGVYLDRSSAAASSTDTIVVFASTTARCWAITAAGTSRCRIEASVGVPHGGGGAGHGARAPERRAGEPDRPDRDLPRLRQGSRRSRDMDGARCGRCSTGSPHVIASTCSRACCGWRMVFDGRYKLVRGTGPQTTFSRAFGPEPLLFDLDDDPWEDRDVAGSIPKVVARLSELLS